MLICATLVEPAINFDAKISANLCGVDESLAETFFGRLEANGILRDGVLHVEADMEKIRDDEHVWHLWLVEFALIVGCAVGELERSGGGRVCRCERQVSA